MDACAKPLTGVRHPLGASRNLGDRTAEWKGTCEEETRAPLWTLPSTRNGVPHRIGAVVTAILKHASSVLALVRELIMPSLTASQQNSNCKPI